MKWKKILILAIVFSLIAAIFVFFMASWIRYSTFIADKNRETHSSNPILNWQTYKNMDLGLKFKYPQSWRVATDDNYLQISQTNSDLAEENIGNIKIIKKEDDEDEYLEAEKFYKLTRAELPGDLIWYKTTNSQQYWTNQNNTFVILKLETDTSFLEQFLGTFKFID